MDKPTKHLYVYDVEVFPNAFTVIFLPYVSDVSTRTFKITTEEDERRKMRDFLLNEVNSLAGYNTSGYDRLIMNAVLEGASNIELYRLSKSIIDRDRNEPMWKDDTLNKYNKPFLNIEDIDLMKLHALDKIGVSLKSVGVILNMPNIIEFEHDWDADFDLDKIQELIDYNMNDVDTTLALLKYSLSELRLRRKVTAQYGVDLMSASRTKIGKTILEDVYQKESGVPKKEFKQWRTHRPFVDVSEIIPEMSFKNESFQKLYDELQDTLIFPDKLFEGRVQSKVMSHKLGQGGIHSENKAEIWESNENQIIIDVDAGSYYPSLMLNYEVIPEHLGRTFLTVLEKLTTQRLKAKKTGDKATADILKISINALYGLLGSDNYFLYDLKAQQTVTINGQLTILKAIDEAEQIPGVECIYSNTDGFSLMVDREQKNKVLALLNKLEVDDNLIWEHELYEKFILRNVNNFYWVHENGAVKAKGNFTYKQDVTKGYRYPIVPKALKAYFIDGIPIEDTIRKETDIMQFCISQKVARRFDVMFSNLEGTTNVQHINRYFVTTKVGSLVKYNHEQDKTISLLAGENAYLLNDYDSSKDYLKYIDYRFYMRETNKVISEFESQQLKLF